LDAKIAPQGVVIASEFTPFGWYVAKNQQPLDGRIARFGDSFGSRAEMRAPVKTGKE
jgi:hypothetical protein